MAFLNELKVRSRNTSKQEGKSLLQYFFFGQKSATLDLSSISGILGVLSNLFPHKNATLWLFYTANRSRSRSATVETGSLFTDHRGSPFLPRTMCQFSRYPVVKVSFCLEEFFASCVKKVMGGYRSDQSSVSHRIGILFCPSVCLGCPPTTKIRITHCFPHSRNPIQL